MNVKVELQSSNKHNTETIDLSKYVEQRNTRGPVDSFKRYIEQKLYQCCLDNNPKFDQDDTEINILGVDFEGEEEPEITVKDIVPMLERMNEKLKKEIMLFPTTNEEKFISTHRKGGVAVIEALLITIATMT